MKKLIMLQGLPGSGKSTWAAEHAHRFRTGCHSVMVINKDQIRASLGGEWSKEQEKRTVQIRDERICNSFRSAEDGVTVISDDTNFAREHKVRLQELATIHGATFEVKKFDTPIEECLKRVQARTTQAAVPEKAIRDMAKRYGVGSGYPPAVPVPYQDEATGLPLHPAIICDLDGTLSLLNGRNPYDASTCDKDLCNAPVRTLLEVYYRTQHYNIIYLSGREDKYRPQTETFFRDNHVPPGALYMRQTGDFRKDWAVKGELFDAHVRGRYAVKFVLDDRNQVVDYWRHLGLTCFQVAAGAF